MNGHFNNEKFVSVLGEDLLSVISDHRVTDVMLNPDGIVWADTFEGVRKCGTLDASRAYNIICTVAGITDAIVDRDNPDISGEIPFCIDNEWRLLRFQGQIPPIVTHPCFTIRIPASRVVTLQEYVGQGIISADEKDFIQEVIGNRQTILVAGSTGSGKTTLLNAILDDMGRQFPEERIITIEDTFELQCRIEKRLAFRSCRHRNMDDLLRNCLRNNPDRIVVGEVRGKEANTMIKAWNTGHPGACTVHASHAIGGLRRIEQLIREGNVIPLPEVIADTINVIIFIARAPGTLAGRTIKEILKVQGYDRRRERYIVQNIKMRQDMSFNRIVSLFELTN